LTEADFPIDSFLADGRPIINNTRRRWRRHHYWRWKKLAASNNKHHCEVNTIVGRSESEFPLFPALQNNFNLTFFAIGRLSASGRLSAHHCQQQRQHEDEEEEEEEAPLSEMNEDAIVKESTYTVSSLYFSFGVKKVILSLLSKQVKF
jgi:hypothetical protein